MLSQGSLRGLLRYGGWLFAAVVFVVIGVGVVALFPAALTAMGKEGGILEVLSVACWATAFLVALWTFLAKPPQPAQRLAASWTALIAALAVLRELDLHVAVNPETLGLLGVRFRVDWWLDGGVSLWLKASWLILFSSLALALIYPLWALRHNILRLARQGDAMVGLFVLAIALSSLGFVFDDLLRKTDFVSLAVRRVAEEGSEMLGAAAFLASALLRSPRWRQQPAQVQDRAFSSAKS